MSRHPVCLNVRMRRLISPRLASSSLAASSSVYGSGSLSCVSGQSLASRPSLILSQRLKNVTTAIIRVSMVFVTSWKGNSWQTMQKMNQCSAT